jgi:cytoskeleton protein RodZ
MDIMNNDTPQTITPLGLALHNARLKASLSVEQVANLLNLNESVVRELEDDVSVLIESGKYAPIYLRGYLVNYAKLVALKFLDEFVEYQQLSKPQARDTSIRATASMAPAGKKRLIPLWFLFVLLFIAILAIVLAKQSGLFVAGEPAAKVKAESSKNVENKSFNPVAINKEILPALKETTAVAEVDETSSEAVIESTVGQTSSEAVIKSTVGQTGSDTVIKSTVDQTSSANKINTKVKSVAVENNEQLEPPKTAINESLNLSFSADCWTEIVDATGERLAFGLYKKDDILSIDGSAPFKMKLGAPGAVAIKYQGKIINPAFTAGQTMQFSIPE